MSLTSGESLPERIGEARGWTAASVRTWLREITILVRTFSPRVIAIDEIGKDSDAAAIIHAGVSGCAVLATAHGSSIEDVMKNRKLEELIQLQIFDRLLVLSSDRKNARYFEIFDREGVRICGRSLLQEPAL